MEEKNYSIVIIGQKHIIQNDTFGDADLNNLEWLFDAIDRRVLPSVIIGGLLLQSLNVVVLLSKQLRNNAIRFLAAMSLVDVLFLLVQLPFLPMPFIAHNGVNASQTAAAYYLFQQNIYVRFVLYPMSRVCLETNTWLAVLVSFERYIALRSTHSWATFACVARYGISKSKLSTLAIFSALLLAIGLNVNCFFDYKSNDTKVNSDSETGIEALDGTGAVARFALTYLLPIVLLLVFNTTLVYLLIQYRSKQLRMRSAKGLQLAKGHQSAGWRLSCWWRARSERNASGRQVRNASESIRCHCHSRSTLNTALMVLAAMLVHLAFDSPGTALTVLVFFKGQAAVRSNIWLVLASHASNVLVLVHCSIDWCAISNSCLFKTYTSLQICIGICSVAVTKYFFTKYFVTFRYLVLMNFIKVFSKI